MPDDTIVRDRLFDLVDYFAGQALCGIISGRAVMAPSEVARRAYEHADAMLNERTIREDLATKAGR